MGTTRTLDKTQRYYNRISRFYDLISSPAERRYTFLGLDLLDLQPGETVLEIGFGTGHALLAISRATAPGGQVYGLDLSPGMIAVACKRLQREPDVQRVHLTCGDARRPPFSGSRFDAILLSFTLEIFTGSGISVVLAECLRLLKPGGRIAVISVSKPKREHLGVSLYERLQRAFPGVIDCQPIPARGCIEQAGFKILRDCEHSLLGFLPLAVVLGEKPCTC